jgi:hypothetical protein
MTDNERILSDCVKGLLQVLSDLEPFIDWEAAGPRRKEFFDMAVLESREALCLGDSCEAGACQWQG